ncbi:phage tail protein [Vibrio sp. S4M6]|uniref:phage tail protein n=1 Tax=Vibrio sinus TaxID=2946865 RepID=UPI002029FBA9|nr:phage tail protein [Vibrio sinus]MCL9783666.1 phage tail protein [Vibrio sinus]
MTQHNSKYDFSDNAQPIEKAIRLAFRDSLLLLKPPYPELLNANNTPSDFLPFLAGERGVIDWYETDDEVFKRETVDGSFRLLQQSGTRAGLRESLNALGFDSTISKGGTPYTLEVEAFLKDKPLSDETSGRVDARISTYKSERDGITVNISRQSEGNQYVAVATEIGITITSEPFVPSGYTSEANQVIGTHNHIRLIATSEPAT